MKNSTPIWLGLKSCIKSYAGSYVDLYTCRQSLRLTQHCQFLQRPGLPGASIPYGTKGPFTRVQIRVRFRVRFHAHFECKPDKDPILYLTPITTVCIHISAKQNQKLTCWTPLAANRTPNRMQIRKQNRTCRRSLRLTQHCQFVQQPGLPGASIPYGTN
jgi:hypothetical protein